MAINHIDKAIYNILYNDSTIDGIVNEIDENNKAIYLYHADNPAYPSIVIESSEDPEFKTMDNIANHFRTQMDIICLAQTLDNVVSLSLAVKSALRGYTGTKGSIQIVRTHFINDYSIPNLDPVESRTLFGRNLTIEVYYKTS